MEGLISISSFFGTVEPYHRYVVAVIFLSPSTGDSETLQTD